MKFMHLKCGNNSGARFSNAPRLVERILGDITPFVSSKRRRLEARNFSVYFNFHSLYKTWKHQSYKISGSEYYEWLFGPVNFSGLSRNGPHTLSRYFLSAYNCVDQIYSEIDTLLARSSRIRVIGLLTMMVLHIKVLVQKDSSYA